MLHHVASDISKHFQWLLLSPGGSMQHECDMRTAISCLLAAANQDVAMKNARTIEACVDRPPRD